MTRLNNAPVNANPLVSECRNLEHASPMLSRAEAQWLEPIVRQSSGWLYVGQQSVRRHGGTHVLSLVDLPLGSDDWNPL
jgi:hypothetical protein